MKYCAAEISYSLFFGTEPHKNHTKIKIMIPSNMANHIVNAISVKINTFFQNRSALVAEYYSAFIINLVVGEAEGNESQNSEFLIL